MQTELSYQAKVLIGTVAVLMDDLPEVAKFHLSRVCLHLTDAIIKAEGTDSLTVQETVNLARKDLFADIMGDPSASPTIKALLEVLETLKDISDEEFENKVPLDDIWFHALDEDDDAPTD